MCLRAIAAAAVLVVLLGMPESAHGQCTQWADTGTPGPPRPFFVAESWGWRSPFGDMVYDSRRHVSVLFGGYTTNRVTTYLFTHRYDGTSWVYEDLPLSSPLPLFRLAPALTFDTARGRTLMFGGFDGPIGFDDLWEYDGTFWYPIPKSGPWPRAAASNPMCYDPYRGRTIMLGASLTVGRWETWEWTGSAWQRGSDLAGAGGSAVTRMVFDIARNRAFVYTQSDSDIYERVFEFTPGATAAQGVWHSVPIAGSPYPTHLGSSLVYDPLRQQIFRIAGRLVNDIYSYEAQTFVWSVALSKWAQISITSDGLPVRGGAAGVYDTARDRLVLYGGFRVYNSGANATTYTDTWEYRQDSPGFLTLPASATVDGGQTAIFAAALIGEGNSLQWLHNGSPVPGATGPILAINNASQASAGGYVLRASNVCGVIDSPPAQLTVRAPVNNSYLTPSVIYSATLSATTLGATPDGTAPCGISNASPDVWHRYTVPYTGSLTMDTCGSDFDTVLSFHSLGLGTVIACNDDAAIPGPGCSTLTSALSMAVNQGDQFLVRVSGYQGAAGHYTLNTKVVPFNNACAAPTPVFSGTYYGNTAGATVDGSASCGTSFGTPDIWYRFRSDCSGTLSLDTAGSSYDTVVSVRTGCAGAEVGCNDDVQIGTLWSSLSVTVQPGVDYLIRVSGFNGATGNVVLHVYPPPLPQDDCAGAALIGLGDHLFATRCATTGSLPLPPWCEDAAGAVPFYDVWYRYIAAAPGVLEVGLCNTSFNAALAVYGSCPTSPYQAVICGARENSCDQPPLASINTLPGDEYLFRIGGYYGLNAGLAGSGTIQLTLVPFETGACCLTVGGCALTSAYECPGVFQGEGSTCSPSPCPSLAGSCCTGTTCTELDAAACDAAGGSFGGTGTTCLHGPLNPVTCCRADINGAGGLGVQDIFDFLSAYFAADPRADFNVSGSVTVQDIFDFLAAYFAGC
jgi:hypothetical protein